MANPYSYPLDSSFIKPPTGYSIQKATVDDAEEISELEWILFPQHSFNEKTLAGEIAIGGGWVALHKGEIIGYSLYRIDGALVDITRLGVLEGHRYQRLGGILLGRAMSVRDTRVLTVEKSNVTAIHLYKRYQFRIVGVLLEHNSWVMACP